jgi:hypothetical protein
MIVLDILIAAGVSVVAVAAWLGGYKAGQLVERSKKK